MITQTYSRFCVVMISVLVGGLYPAAVGAQSQQGYWMSQSDVLLRAQPVGLAWLPRLGYRVPLTDSQELLHAGTHVEAGMVSSVSPATLHMGGYFKVVPLAPLVLKVEAQQLRFLGLFGQLRTFDNPPEWSDLDQPLSVKDGRHATGYKVRAESILRILVGPVLAIASYSGNWHGIDVQPEHTWYDPTLDMIFERNDFMHEAHGNLAAVIWGHPKDKDFLALGVRWHTMVTEKTDFKRQMIGGLMIWKPGILTAQDFTVLTTVCGYLEDPYRTGPYVAGALRMTWERLGETP